MTSFTYTLHGLAAIFQHAKKKIGFDLTEAEGGDTKVMRTLRHHFKRLAEEAENCQTLTVGGFSTEKQLTTWLKQPSKSVWKVSDSMEIFLGADYQYNQKWQYPLGEQEPIKDKYKAFGVSGIHYGDVVSLDSVHGSEVVIWTPKETSDGRMLYREALSIGRLDGGKKVEVVLPFVELNDSGSYGLEGLHDGEWTVAKSVYENSLSLTAVGAKAKSQVVVKMTKSKPQPPKRIVFDKPFAVAIYEPDMDYPTFVARCGYDCWLKDE